MSIFDGLLSLEIVEINKGEEGSQSDEYV